MNLRGLPRGKVVVKVVAVTTAGAKLTSTRTYRTCTAGEEGQEGREEGREEAALAEAEAAAAVTLVAEALAVVVLDVAGVLGLVVRVAHLGEPAGAGEVRAAGGLVEDPPRVDAELLGAAAVQRRDQQRLAVVVALRDAQADEAEDERASGCPAARRAPPRARSTPGAARSAWRSMPARNAACSRGVASANALIARAICESSGHGMRER